MFTHRKIEKDNGDTALWVQAYCTMLAYILIVNTQGVLT